jgi:hypothetical protein
VVKNFSGSKAGKAWRLASLPATAKRGVAKLAANVWHHPDKHYYSQPPKPTINTPVKMMVQAFPATAMHDRKRVSSYILFALSNPLHNLSYKQYRKDHYPFCLPYPLFKSTIVTIKTHPPL